MKKVLRRYLNRLCISRPRALWQRYVFGFIFIFATISVSHWASLATIEAARAAIRVMCARAAMAWGIEEDAVEWVDGHARPAGPNAGKFPPMSLAEIAAIASKTGGPIAGHHEVNA